MKSKGIIHVHSDFSYDGEHSLEEIAQYAIRRGYSFIGMSEHSNTFNENRMSEYVKECQQVSTPECLIITGIEFTCEDNLHLIGLGIHHYTDSKDPLKVAEFIHQQRGLAIIAHPSRYDYHIPLNMSSVVDGIEVWNVAYDGRFVPNPRSLNLIKEMRRQNSYLLAFGGQELHRIMDQCNVEITLSCNRIREDAIMHALKEGKFAISNPWFQIDARHEPGWLKLAQIQVARWMYDRAKGMRDRIGASL